MGLEELVMLFARGRIYWHGTTLSCPWPSGRNPGIHGAFFLFLFKDCQMDFMCWVRVVNKDESCFTTGRFLMNEWTDDTRKPG